MDQEVNLSVNLDEFLEQEKLNECVMVRRPRDVFKVQEISLRRSMILRAFQDSPISSTPKPNSKHTHSHNWNFTSVESSPATESEDESKVSPVAHNTSKKKSSSTSDDKIELVLSNTLGTSSLENKIEPKSDNNIETVVHSDLNPPSVTPVEEANDVREIEKSLRNADQEVENTPVGMPDITRRRSILLTDRNSLHCNGSNKSVRFQTSSNPSEILVLSQDTGEQNQISNDCHGKDNSEICEHVCKTTEDAKENRVVDNNSTTSNEKSSPSKLHESRIQSIRSMKKHNRELFVSLKADSTDNLNFFSTVNEETVYDIDFSIKPQPCRFSIDSNDSVKSERSSIGSRLWRSHNQINVNNKSDMDKSENIVYNSNISLDPLNCTEMVKIEKRVYSRPKHSPVLPDTRKAIKEAGYSLQSVSSSEINVNNELLDKSPNKSLHITETNSQESANSIDLQQEAQSKCQIISTGQENSQMRFDNNFLEESIMSLNQSFHTGGTNSDVDTGYEDVTEGSQPSCQIMTVGQERGELMLTKSKGPSMLSDNFNDMHEADANLSSNSLEERINSTGNIDNSLNESIIISSQSLLSMRTNSEKATDPNEKEEVELRPHSMTTAQEKDSEIRACEDQEHITYPSSSRRSPGSDRTTFGDLDRVLMDVSNKIIDSKETESKIKTKLQFTLNNDESDFIQNPIVQRRQELCPRMTGRSIASNSIADSFQSSNATLRRSGRDRKICRNFSVGVLVLDSHSDLKLLKQLGMGPEDVERAYQSLGKKKNKNMSLRKSRLSKRNTQIIGSSDETIIASKGISNSTVDANLQDNMTDQISSHSRKRRTNRITFASLNKIDESFCVQTIDENATTTTNGTKSKRSQVKKQLSMGHEDVEKAYQSLEMKKSKDMTLRKSRLSKRNTQIIGSSDETIASKGISNGTVDANLQDNMTAQISSHLRKRRTNRIPFASVNKTDETFCVQTLDENATTTINGTKSKRSQEMSRDKSRQSERKSTKSKRKKSQSISTTRTEAPVQFGIWMTNETSEEEQCQLDEDDTVNINKEMLATKSCQAERKSSRSKRKVNQTKTEAAIELGVSKNDESNNFKTPQIPPWKSSKNLEEKDQLDDSTVNAKKKFLAINSCQAKRKSTKNKHQSNQMTDTSRTETSSKLGRPRKRSRNSEQKDQISIDENATNTSKAAIEKCEVSQRRSNRNRKQCITYFQELVTQGEVSYGNHRKRPKLKNGGQITKNTE